MSSSLLSDKREAKLSGASPEVREFCSSNGLNSWIQRALDLVVRHFNLAKDVKLSLRDDPEVEDRVLEVEILVRGEPDEAVKAYRGFVEAWVGTAPSEVRDKMRLNMGVSD